MLHTIHFFSSKCRLFHNVTFFGSCIIRILHTGCAKIQMPNSGAKRLRNPSSEHIVPETSEIIQNFQGNVLKKIPFPVPWTVRIRCSFPVTLLCTLVSKCITLTRLFSFAGRLREPRPLSRLVRQPEVPHPPLFPVAITTTPASYVTQHSFSFSLSGYSVCLYVSVSVCVFLNALWVSERTNGENKEQRKGSSRLTLNIPSLPRQRSLPSWGPQRAPCFFFF
jgi:hypothetical protein